MVQLEKAFSPIVVIVLGIVTDSIEVFLKPSFANFVTGLFSKVDGNTRLPVNGLVRVEDFAIAYVWSLKSVKSKVSVLVTADFCQIALKTALPVTV